MEQNLSGIRTFNVLRPVANAFAGTVYPDAVDMSGVGTVCFTLYKGVGTTGTTTVTVVASDDNSPSNETAIEFLYRRTAAGGVAGAVTKATTAGFATTAGSADSYEIWVDAQAMANTGYKWVQPKLVELVASAVLGGMTATTFDSANAPTTASLL